MEIPRDMTIVRVEAGVIAGSRPRIVGRNARWDVHGQLVREPVVRLHTDAGVVGWGWAAATPEAGQRLVGRKLHEVFDLESGTADDFLASSTPTTPTRPRRRAS